MSAFVVPKAHIDLLVDLGLRGPSGAQASGSWQVLYWFAASPTLETASELRRSARPQDADRIGEMLMLENVKSVNDRYEDSDDLPGPTDAYWLQKFKHKPQQYQLTAVEGLKAINCYGYQSCEHEGWEASEAYRYCQALRASLIHNLPGYDAATWKWSALAVEAAVLNRSAVQHG